MLTTRQNIRIWEDIGVAEFKQNCGRVEFVSWLDVPQRFTFKLCMTKVYRLSINLGAWQCPSVCAAWHRSTSVFVPVANIASRCQLRSASPGLVYVLRYNLTNYGRRSFSYAGHHAWNLLPENVWKSTSMAIFKRSLKTFLSVWELWKNNWGLANMGRGAAGAEKGEVWGRGIPLPSMGGAWGRAVPPPPPLPKKFFFNFLAQNSAFRHLFWQE